jgi:asparagine synthase (glutamine-hydrolysing)
MVGSLHHRGPDDQGLERILCGESEVILGSTRLAILDLSSAGHMPMRDDASGNWVVYNGEVYNFAEIRAELVARGETFQSDTDTEVVLKAHRTWGDACLMRFQGMFAFAIWDARERQLLLYRDGRGKKPLYFTQKIPGGGLCFASEVRALLASGLVEPRLNQVALESFLYNGFVVGPHTIIQDVWSVMPGTVVVFDATGRKVVTRRWWKLPGQILRKRRNELVIDEIRSMLDLAVAQRMVSDVPVGAFLSGGLDSSTIVALMARHNSEVRTFSITFDEADFDESPYSHWVSKRFATRHTEVRLTSADFASQFQDAVNSLDQPSFDGVNSYIVSRAARESGLTVALSGLGGDELFGGYPFFAAACRMARVAVLTSMTPECVGTALRKLMARRGGMDIAGPAKLLEILAHGIGGLGRRVLAAYQATQLLFPTWSQDQLLGSGRAIHHTWLGLPREFIDFILDESAGPVPDRVCAALMRLFLGERCLRDTDCTSMAVSLEVRAPLTDRRLIEAVWQVPAHVRCHGSPNKPFMWELVKPFLGADYPVRRKQGFTFPFKKWLNEEGTAKDIVWNTLSDRSAADRLGFNPRFLKTVANNFHANPASTPWSRVWSIYVIMNWCTRHRVAA